MVTTQPEEPSDRDLTGSPGPTEPAIDMDLEQLRELCDAARFVGRAPQQVDRFLAEWVQPTLARLEAGANERLGEPDVRV